LLDCFFPARWSGSNFNQALGFDLAPVLTSKWLLPRLVSVGIWVLLFLLPFWGDDLIKKRHGSQPRPAADDALHGIPQNGRGPAGLKLGHTAPLFALFFTLIKGISAGLDLRVVKK
jgi:hypothetical protein